MGKYDLLGEKYPVQSRYFNGEEFELYDGLGVHDGTTRKAVAQKAADELRKHGNRARVVKSMGKYWVYWS